MKYLLLLTLLHAPSGETYMHREVVDGLSACFDRAYEVGVGGFTVGLTIEYSKCLRLQPEVML